MVWHRRISLQDSKHTARQAGRGVNLLAMTVAFASWAARFVLCFVLSGGSRDEVPVRVLLAVDGSEASQAAIDVLKGMSWTPDSRARVISVAERVCPPPPPAAGLVLGNVYADAASTSITEVQKSQQRRAADTAEAAASEIRRATPDLPVEAIGLSGDPRNVIIDQASDWNADLIVLGSHGRAGLRRWLLGSVAEYVVRHAPCSVQVARTPRGA